jgi:hypothetical protein
MPRFGRVLEWDQVRRVRLRRSALQTLRLVHLLVLASLCAGCAFSTGPAHRVKDFQHLALQLDAEPEQVHMAGKVQWHPGAESIWHGYARLEQRTQDYWARRRAECRAKAQQTNTDEACIFVGRGREGGYPNTGVFLLTDYELAFFRSEDDAYVIVERFPLAEIDKVHFDRIGGIGAKYIVIYKNGQPLLLYVLVNSYLNSYAGTEALYEALMERVRWEARDPAP